MRIDFQGHAAIQATDPQILEILESNEWSRRASAIGYAAAYSPEELLALRGRVLAEIEVGALRDSFEATIATTFHRGQPLVFRRDTLVRAKPLAWQSSKASADIERPLIEALRARDAVGHITLTVLGDQPPPAPGTLVLVAMPIGNQADLSPRANDILASVDVILAEDTRVAEDNLRWRGIRTPVLSCYEHNEKSRVSQVRDRLAAGARIALISDAGTPLISDPGYLIVQAAREVGAHLQAVPGPSAVMLALMLSALPVANFRFAGFAPRSGSERERFLTQVLASDDTSVLFEASHRIAALLEQLRELAPDRRVSVCKDLTKRSEAVFHGSAESVVAQVSGLSDLGGEYTVVVAPCPAPPNEAESATVPIDAFIEALLRENCPTAPIVRALRTVHGLSKQEAYKRVLSLKKTDDADEAPPEQD